ncbi:MAG: DUF1295 domain-containing protein [Pseudomonadota bacterium]
MTPLNAFLTAVAIVFVAKTAAWLLQLKTKNAGLVDAIWAWTLGGLALHYAAAGTAPDAIALLLAVMGGLWGLRLGAHLWVRNWGKPEDWRYAQFRAKWGAHSNRNMFFFFQFQNIFTLVLAGCAFLPVAYRSDLPSGFAIAAALGIYVTSILGELLADSQMERFRANPMNKGRVCQDGLWRYSRHPNYFFECLHWLAYVPLALGAPYGWISLGAPLVMAFLLMKMSGVPLLEAEMIRRKPGYADYVRTTSALIPFSPKK